MFTSFRMLQGTDNASMADSTGGTITTSGGYRIHTFTTSGTFKAAISGSVQYLIVAGGGSTHGNAQSGRWWW